MYEIIKWEIGRIFKDRKNQVAICVGTIGMLLFIYAVINENATYITRTGGFVSGIEAIRDQKEFRRNLEGELTEEKIGKEIKYFQTHKDEFFEKFGGVQYWTGDGYEYYSPRKDYLQIINENYDLEERDDTGYTNLLRLELDGENARFYETRDAQIMGMLFDDDGDGYYNEKEAQYWAKRYQELDEKIYYGDSFGWQQLILNSIALLIPLFLVCFCLSSVYAGEYEQNTYGVLLTTKNGKSKLVTGKKLASLAVALLIFTVELILYYIVTLGLCGLEGANHKVQSCGIFSLYNCTYWQAALMNIGIEYLILIVMAMLSIGLSSKTRSVLPGFFIIVLFTVGSMFIQQVPTFEWLKARVLLPDIAMGLFSTTFTATISYSIGNIVLNVFQMAAILYLGFAIVLYKLAGRSFTRYC